MDESIEKQLADLFDAHDTKQEDVRQAKNEREQKELVFLSRFLERRASVFRPAFESFAKAVQSRGIRCQIEDLDEKATAQHNIRPASITITFLIGDNGNRPSSEYPYLRISCEKHSSMLAFHRSTLSPGRGGQIGPAGKAGIEDVTENSLHERLVELLRLAL